MPALGVNQEISAAIETALLNLPIRLQIQARHPDWSSDLIDRVAEQVECIRRADG